MNIKIYPKKLKGSVDVVSSKSLSHRYVIAAALSKGESYIENILESDDLHATQNALIKMNAKINGPVIIGGNLKRIDQTIDCMESGSTIRFMIPIAMLLDEAFTFTGSGKLPMRPLTIYEELFNQPHLVYKKHTENALPITVKGPLKSGIYEVLGNVSSQFITGLLYALPLVHGDSCIKIVGELESKGYVDLTLDVLKRFGIHIEVKDHCFLIKGDQIYQPTKACMEGDFSQAAFFIVAATIGDALSLNRLNLESLQGDAQILDIIKEMGGRLHIKDGVLHVEPSQTQGITIDLKQIPDLGPILMVLAALSEGKTTFLNVSRLKIKESDRLLAMHDVLSKLGVNMEIKGNQAVVFGVKQFKGGITLNSFDDHRIAMAIAIASIRCLNPIVLEHADVVRKSYPNFFEVFKSLGGAYEIT